MLRIREFQKDSLEQLGTRYQGPLLLSQVACRAIQLEHAELPPDRAQFGH
jgi:hypothetical protein